MTQSKSISQESCRHIFSIKTVRRVGTEQVTSLLKLCHCFLFFTVSLTDENFKK